MEPILDHIERTKSFLLEQFKGKENFEKLVKVLVAPLQECEDVAWQLFALRSLPNAEGAQLDGIGDIFGVPRAGLTDPEYREAIYRRIYEIGVSGTPDELLGVLESITGAQMVRYTGVFPASVQLFVVAETIPPGLLDFMTRLTGAGINLWILAFEGMLPGQSSGDQERQYLLINGDQIEINDDDILVIGSAGTLPFGVAAEYKGQPIGLSLSPFLGTCCDIDPDGNFHMNEHSGSAFDVLQAG